jgi:cysteinyl-tRNA synthetase
LVLQELGFQAGQHEVLSEMLTIKLQQEVQMKAKEILKFTKKNLKDAKIISEDLNLMYKDVEKTKNKYKKSFLDWEDAKDNYMKAEKDGILSRKEITKLKSLSNSRNAQCEDYKGAYASQLVKTNKYQEKYYYKDLSGVINSLQNIEIDRIEYFKRAMNQCVAAEKQVAPINDKCREDMENLLKSINPVADSCIIITR